MEIWAEKPPAPPQKRAATEFITMWRVLCDSANRLNKVYKNGSMWTNPEVLTVDGLNKGVGGKWT